MSRASGTALFVLILALLGACAEAPPPGLTLVAARYADLPGWESDRQGEALAALRRSCGRIERLANEAPSDRLAGPKAQARGGHAADWRPACAALAAVDGQDHAAVRSAIEQHFRPFRALGQGSPSGLFTGYYEPELKGSRRRHGPYTQPIYARPPDLIEVDLGRFSTEWQGRRLVGRLAGTRLEPYPDRAVIDGGALAGKELELAWVDSAVDAFFLQIQGSGRVALEDGSLLRLGYAAGNGQPYVAIGRVLVEKGAMSLDQVSLQSIKAWLVAHPEEAPAVLQRNPSYVFFQVLNGDGPNGSEGVMLTAGRSLAVDRSFLPLGLPIWLDVADPLEPGSRVRRLVVAQDTGGAIKGPVRGDLFWGHGPEAEARAGRMRSAGGYWLLIPLAVAAQIRLD